MSNSINLGNSTDSDMKLQITIKEQIDNEIKGMYARVNVHEQMEVKVGFKRKYVNCEKNRKNKRLKTEEE